MTEEKAQDAFYGDKDEVQKLRDVYKHANASKYIIERIKMAVRVARLTGSNDIILRNDRKQAVNITDFSNAVRERTGYAFQAVPKFLQDVTKNQKDKVFQRGMDKVKKKLIPGTDVFLLMNAAVRSDKTKLDNGNYSLKFGLSEDKDKSLDSNVPADEVIEILHANNLKAESVHVDEELKQTEMVFTPQNMHKLEHRVTLLLEALNHKDTDPFVYIMQQKDAIDRKVKAADDRITNFIQEFNTAYDDEDKALKTVVPIDVARKNAVQVVDEHTTHERNTSADPMTKTKDIDKYKNRHWHALDKITSPTLGDDGELTGKKHTITQRECRAIFNDDTGLRSYSAKPTGNAWHPEEEELDETTAEIKKLQQLDI